MILVYCEIICTYSCGFIGTASFGYKATDGQEEWTVRLQQ